VELAQGVDDDTWMFHLKNQDYSKWIRHAVNDDTLAEQVGRVETSEQDPASSRSSIAKLIQLHYTGPA